MTAPNADANASLWSTVKGWIPRRTPGSTPVLIIMGAAILIGAAAAVLSGAWGGAQSGIRPALLMFALIGAATLVGEFVGFLFGLPRFDYAAREAAAASAAKSAAAATGTPASSDSTVTNRTFRYRPSANLEEIADWLTKIIVGLGLTQLTNVGPALTDISNYVVTECGAGCPSRSMAAAVIVYGAVAGLMHGYIWTRLRYVKAAAAADVVTTQTLRQLDEDAVRLHGVGGKRPPQEAAASEAGAVTGELRAPGNDDPNKGQFGGRAFSNDRALWAVISASEVGADLYRVFLTVTSTNPAKPLTGRVTFHLHPTFKQPIVSRNVEDGVATLVIVAWGAFTVGAVVESDGTKLELDLSQLPDAPSGFRNR